jgi:hypothetical protein
MPSSVNAAYAAKEDFADFNRDSYPQILLSASRPIAQGILKSQSTACCQQRRGSDVGLLPQDNESITGEGNDVSIIIVDRIRQD